MKQQTNEEILHKIFSYKKEGVRVLIGGLLIKMMIGIFFAWPIMFSFHSIMIQYDSISRFKQSLMFFTFPLMNLTMNICLPKGDYVLGHYGPKQTVILFTSLMSITFTLIGFAKDNVYLHFILLIFVVGPSVGCLYMVPFQITWRYFIKQKGQLNSIFQIFMGIGTCLAIYVFEQRTNNGNPLSQYYDKNELQIALCYQLDIRESYRQLALIVLAMGVLAAILIKKPDESDTEAMIDYDLLAYSHQDVYLYQGDQEVDSLDKDIPTLEKSLRSNQFKIMTLIAFSSTFLCYIFFSQYQRIVKELGIDYSISINTFKISIIFYGLFRTLLTFLSNKYKYQNTIVTLLIIKTSLTILLIFGLATQNKYVSLISCSGMVVILGGIFSSFSIYIPRVFGASVAQAIFSTIIIFLAISNILAQIASFWIVSSILEPLLIISVIVLIIQVYIIRLLIKERQ